MQTYSDVDVTSSCSLRGKSARIKLETNSATISKRRTTDQRHVELVRVALRIGRVDAQRDAVGEDRHQDEIFKRSGAGSLSGSKQRY